MRGSVCVGGRGARGCLDVRRWQRRLRARLHASCAHACIACSHDGASVRPCVVQQRRADAEAKGTTAAPVSYTELRLSALELVLAVVSSCV